MKLLDTKNLFFSAALVITSALLYSFSYAPDQDEWVVPAKYNSMVNPTDAGDAEALAVGPGRADHGSDQAAGNADAVSARSVAP